MNEKGFIINNINNNNYKTTKLNKENNLNNKKDYKLINKEKYDEIIEFMGKELSSLEYQVMDLYIIGLKTPEIAKVLGKNEKTTDNAFQRAKGKIRKFLEER